MDFRDAVTFTVACISAAAVVISIVLAIYYGSTNNNKRYYDAMNTCIQSQGSWVPSVSGGSCIMNRQ